MGNSSHSLAGYADGSVWAWGYNVYGQLGDNTKTNKSSPIAVAGSRSFDKISAEKYHSLALDASDGLVYAWGGNTYGQLGDNTTTGQSSPIAVAGSKSFDEIVAGYYHGLALDASDGLAYAWGRNDYGQLGDNTTTNKSSPVAVAGSRSFDKIASGRYHSLALDASDGLAYAWGSNGNGQLGDNTKTSKSSPIAVAGSRSFDAIAGGRYHSLALDASDGLAYAWGSNGQGQLGNNTIIDKSSPVPVAGNRSFDEIAGGTFHSLARDASTGLVYAWGNNAQGQLGDNTTTDKSSPIAVAGSRSFDEIAIGDYYSLALDASDGSVWAWGSDVYGRLGDNTTTNKSSPIPVAGSRSFAFLSEMPPSPPEPGSVNLVSKITVIAILGHKNLISRISTVVYSLTNLVCRLSTTGWGRVKVQVDEIALSPVKDTGNTDTKKITINTNTYQTGSGTGKIYVRGQAATFIQDAESPAWIEYTTATEKEWRYIQLKIATS